MESVTVINWGANVDESDLVLFQAISNLFSLNKELIPFFFKADSPRLAQAPEVLKFESGAFSNAEQLLVKVALDIWDGAGGAHFNELYQVLDSKRFSNVIHVLQFLKVHF